MTLVYLYGVIPASAEGWLESNDLRGIAGGRVRGVRVHGVIGCVGDVPAAEFDQEPLDRNVGDPDWLAPHAEAHQRVNAALLEAAGSVIPLAFGTIFRAESGVREALGAQIDPLREALARLEGRVEWVCTLDRDRRVAVEHLERSRSGTVAAGATGRAYLERRKTELEGSEALRALDAEANSALHEALVPLADEITDEPLIEGGPVARVTVLLEREREAALRDALAGLASHWRDRGYEPRLVGPWPAYRFGSRVGALHER